jgi:hypothetical protein
MMSEGRRRAARSSGILAQALTAWALVMLIPSGNWISGVFLFTALIVPFRTDGTRKDLAISNFSSGLVVWGVLTTQALDSLLDRVLRGSASPLLTPHDLLLLTATVMFVFAGAFYWIQRDDPPESPE